MTFWDFAHAHVWLMVAGGIAGLIVAVLASIAYEDRLITWHNIERMRAIAKGKAP